MRQDGVRWIAGFLVISLASGCRDLSIRHVGLEMGPPAGYHVGNSGALISDDPSGAPASTRLSGALASAVASRASVGVADDLAIAGALDAMNQASKIFLTKAESDDPKAAAEQAKARAIYNRGLETLLVASGGRRIRLDESWRAEMAARGIRVTIRRDDSVWSPEQFDQFTPVSEYQVRGLEPMARTEGVGVSLIAERRFRFRELESRQGQDKYLMPRQVVPVTAVLRVASPGDPARGVRPDYLLELHDPLRTDRVDFGPIRQPLATDLSTSLAFHFAHSPLPILQEIGLLDPQWLEKLSGLYMLHPYERGKIPVILVHGLRSSPAAWTKVINALRADPTLRSRYQFWLFMYPTGIPFPYSAARLRERLAELRAIVDPEATDPALGRTVMIGHSMGGLVTKMLIVGSGDEIWKLVSTQPFEALKTSPERRELLRKVFFFEPDPTIERVVFIATPHRGSELGDQFIGRLTDRLIRLPGSLRATYRSLLIQNGRDFFTPTARRGLPSSIDELRPNNPLLKTMNALPFRQGVTYHSVIGQKEPGPVALGSDGVVPYWSSHLEGAASELVVQGDHGCQDEPDTVGDLRRILYAHIGKQPPANADGITVPLHDEKPMAGRVADRVAE